ncbi:MAG: LamG-like jellyroll fold domain-containing protein [Thiogranum sp.]
MIPSSHLRLLATLHLLALAVASLPASAAPLTASPGTALPGDSIVISGTQVQAGAKILLWGSPAVVGNLSLPGFAWDITVSGNYAYIASGPAGLQVVNITDINNPTLAANLPLSGNALKLTLTGNQILVATESAGMQVVDISNPQAPVLLSAQPQPSSTSGISETNSYAYTANRDQKVVAAADSELESLALHVKLDDRALGRSGSDLTVEYGPGPLTLGEIASGTLTVPAITYSIENSFGQTGASPLFPGGTQDGPIIVGDREDFKSTLNFVDSPAIISIWISNVNAPAPGSIVSAGPNDPINKKQGGWSIFMDGNGKIWFVIGRRNNPNGANCSTSSIWGSSPVVTDGKRHHVIAVYDPAKDELYTYIDGVKGGIRQLLGCRADSEGDDSGSGDGVDRDWFSIGEAGAGTGGRLFFNGTVENLHILKPALIPPEIDTIVREWYTLGSPGPIGASFF